jgi:two-component sensor histidine kinase
MEQKMHGAAIQGSVQHALKRRRIGFLVAGAGLCLGAISFLKYYVEGGIPVTHALIQLPVAGPLMSALVGWWTARAPSHPARMTQALLFIAIGYILSLNPRVADVTSAVFVWTGGFLAFDYRLMDSRRGAKLSLVAGIYVVLLVVGLYVRSGASPVSVAQTIVMITALVYVAWIIIDLRWDWHVERSNTLERHVEQRSSELARRLHEAQDLSERLETALENEKDLAQQKELLIREVHHRTKNNMQMVSSLISLELSHVADPDAALALEKSTRRVQALAVVHEQLYNSSNLTVVDLARYLESLIQHLRSSMESSRIAIETAVPESAAGDVDTAIPLGIIVNELVTHATMQALQESDQARIRVSLSSDGDQYLLEVQDNGCGADCSDEDLEAADEDRVSQSLVHGLAAQLGGHVSHEYSEGNRWSVRFPMHMPSSARDRLPNET